MTVASLINLFESIDRRAHPQTYSTHCTSSPKTLYRHYSGEIVTMPSSSSRKMKLSLHTMFTPHGRSQPSPRSRARASDTPSTRSPVPAPTPMYQYLTRPQTPVNRPTAAIAGGFLSPSNSSTTSSPSSSATRSPRSTCNQIYIRRHPSAIDVALAAERRSSSSTEYIGLGLLEPRPRAVSGASSVGGVSLMEVMESGAIALPPQGQGEVVLDGIFEVLEREL